MKSNRVSCLNNREDLDENTLYSKYYNTLGDHDEVLEILHHVSGEVQMPIGKLRPDDEFKNELAPTKGWEFDNGMSLLFENVVTTAKKSGRQVDISNISTLNDYIRIRLLVEKGLF